MEFDLSSCNICPRKCGADRYSAAGVCGCGVEMSLAKVMLHKWEEPAVSSGEGAGCIFFGGCPLGCVFCQNKAISRSEVGEKVSPERLGEIMLELQARGASSIDLVSPTQYTPLIIRAVSLVRNRLNLPIVWNTGGYERRETVLALRGTVDVFLTDFKYGSENSGAKYANAPDYSTVAEEALSAMVECVGTPKFSESGIMESGVIVRLLVLPGERRDAVSVLERIKKAVGTDSAVLSLMSQYTPDFAPDGEGFRNLRRRVTTFEYEYVRDTALDFGFTGFAQDRNSADQSYTPDFEVD